jgi:hypothetical protein
MGQVFTVYSQRLVGAILRCIFVFNTIVKLPPFCVGIMHCVQSVRQTLEKDRRWIYTKAVPLTHGLGVHRHLVVASSHVKDVRQKLVAGLDPANSIRVVRQMKGKTVLPASATIADG